MHHGYILMILDGHWSDEAPYIVGRNAMQTKGFNCSTQILLHGRQSVRIDQNRLLQLLGKIHPPSSATKPLRLSPYLSLLFLAALTKLWGYCVLCRSAKSLAEPESGLVLMSTIA